ncbi:MAG: hypothetical protein ACKN82_21405, partial [Pirellula sp.]
LFAADFDIDTNGQVDCLDSLAMIDALHVDHEPAASSFQIWTSFPVTAKKYAVSATGKLASRKVAELTSTSSTGIYG